jgi:DNA-binding IclR family transcriptional regulator
MDVEARSIQSVVIGGRLLAVMAAAGRPLMLRDIAAGAALTPAQAHAYLVSFSKSGLAEQVSESGLYQLGPFALQLGLARMRSVDAQRLVSAAVPDLATELGFMITVAAWGTFGATIVQVQEAVDQIHVKLRPGAVYGLRTTATGRVFAAFLPEHVIKAHLESERRSGTAGRRIGGASDRDFASEVKEARRLRYATAVGSPIPGINAISAPVFGHTGQLQVAVTLIGPAQQLEIGPGSPHVDRLTAFVSSLSAELGYKPGWENGCRSS